MTPSVDLSRRRALQLLSGAAVLPLAACDSLAGWMAAPGAAKPTSVRFVGMAAPSLAEPAQMATTAVGSSLVADYADGTQRTFKLAYEPFFITGTQQVARAGGAARHGAPVSSNPEAAVDASPATQVK